ncbi:hypothetical protein M3Y96_00293700 [Aphelenchoides besseyi]|nr:hypothetical protein M3Y96_00293700 [Aphelenchoides besseyi]
MYFYVSFEKRAKKWNIFGFAVDQKSLKWEFVGGLDIEIDNVRLVDIRTLAYEDFKTPDFPFTELTNHVRSAHFQHTSHGTYLFVYAHFSNGPTFKSIDEIFTMDVDSENRQVHFKRIDLPKLPTEDLYPDYDDRFPDTRYAK